MRFQFFRRRSDYSRATRASHLFAYLLYLFCFLRIFVDIFPFYVCPRMVAGILIKGNVHARVRVGKETHYGLARNNRQIFIAPFNLPSFLASALLNLALPLRYLIHRGCRASYTLSCSTCIRNILLFYRIERGRRRDEISVLASRFTR